MSELHDLEDDNEALDAFLMSDQAPEDCMQLTDLDGFLTGIAIGPELILPSEWLPVIWGGEAPTFDNADQAQAIIGIIMNRYNNILGLIAEGRIEPIFMESPGGEVIASDWAEGFLQAIRLRFDAWQKLFKSEKQGHTLLPILALCCNEDGESLLDLSEGAENQFFEEAGELIPRCVLEIAEFWRGARTAPQRKSTGPKVGRNDPCPCGSGKKFKKCCGIEH
jgi:uncharacterized protein